MSAPVAETPGLAFGPGYRGAELRRMERDWWRGVVRASFAGLGEFDLPSRGIFSWNLKFEVTDISKAIEVRLTLSKSAIEGSLFLREVRCSIEQEPSSLEERQEGAVESPLLQRPRKSKPGRSPSTTNSP